MTPALLAVTLAVAAIIGLVLGSFLTVLVYRIPRQESVVKPRSRCPGCGASLKRSDNIPVFAWIRRRGRCATCGEKISLRYPLTELASGGLVVTAMLAFDPDLYLGLLFGVFFVILLGVSLIDLEHGIIPNAIIYPSVPGFGVAILLGWAIGAGVDPLGALAGFLAYGGTLLVVALIFPRGMGMGDVKLVALIGLVLGSLGLGYVAVAAAAGVLVGGFVGAIVMATGRGGRGATMPFGPSLAAGAAIAALWGPSLGGWYLSMFPGS